MAAVGFVEVFAAGEAQAAASGSAQGLDGHFDQGVLANEGAEVDVAVFGEEKLGFGGSVFVEGVEFGEFGVDGEGEGLEATVTEGGEGGEQVDLDEQALGGATDVGVAGKVGEVEIGRQVDVGVVKRKISAVAGGLVDEKTDIQPEGEADFLHGVGD